MTYKKVALVGILVVAAITVPIWQQTRIKSLQSDNQELEAQVKEFLKQSKQTQQAPTNAFDPSELARLRASQAEMRSELLQLRGRLGATLREKAQLEAKALMPSQALDPANKNTNTFVSGMADYMKSAMNQQVEGQLMRMKARINLSPEQENAMREILLKQAEVSSKAIQKVFAGKTSLKELRDGAEPMQNPEEQIKSLLNSEQLSQYKEYKKDENQANARLVANSELLQIQGSLNLTQEQQDQVFGIIYENTMRTFNADSASGMPPKSDPVALLEWQNEQKSKSLSSVLSPEQIETYKKLQATQVQFLRNMLPADATQQK
jgi:hypothetical protein